MRRTLSLAAASVFTAITLSGCATLQEVAALRSVTFEFDRVSDVRIAGVALGADSRFTTLGLGDGARLAAAVVSREVPLELTVHVRAKNPPENHATALMTNIDWKLFVEDRQAVAGTAGNLASILPGRAADIPLAIRFDLLALANGGARDLFDTALAIAGYGTGARALRLELIPTIDTSLGPIRYPAPIVLRRAATP